MPSADLPDRTVLAVEGEEARAFLDRIVTCDLAPAEPGRAAFGALLSPQGKILADFLVHAVPSGFLLDVAEACADDLAKRLNLYRLRARVAIGRRAGSAVRVGWEEPLPSGVLAAAPDPRLPALGWRAIRDGAAGSAGDAHAYEARRIALGVPEAGRDVPFGDAYPHEALMDQLGGVDFRKGCYVGQEIVSRTQHRGTARTRAVRVAADRALAAGATVTGGERALGRIGTVDGPRGIAILRLDRAADALAAGEPILAEGATLRLEKPDWVRFPYPDELASPAA